MSPSTKSVSKKNASKTPAAKPDDKKPDKPGDDKQKKCKPFSVSVLVNTNDEKREIIFGLTHGCNADNTDFWTIDFTLKEKKGNEMKTRVEVHVVIGRDQEKEKAKADALAADMKKKKKLDDERTDLLQTEVADRALQIPAGQAQNDPELKNLLVGVL